MDSIQYYNTHSESFYKRTIHADMDTLHEKFLSYLKVPSKILDAGCGVGRDSKFFLSQGHTIQAFDGSREMVRLASRELNQEVLHTTFQSITFTEEFDAVWACASLLHVPYEELPKVMGNIRRALKPSGIFYASFKYGDVERKEGERQFFDLNEEVIAPHLENLFSPIEIWESEDNRSVQAPSPRKSWLNILCKAI